MAVSQTKVISELVSLQTVRSKTLEQWKHGNRLDRRKAELVEVTREMKGVVAARKLSRLGVRVGPSELCGGDGVFATEKIRDGAVIAVSTPEIKLLHKPLTYRSAGYMYTVDTKLGKPMKKYLHLAFDYSVKCRSNFLRYINSCMGTGVLPNVTIIHDGGHLVLKAIGDIETGQQLLEQYYLLP